jgi:hypothetical protein
MLDNTSRKRTLRPRASASTYVGLGPGFALAKARSMCSGVFGIDTVLSQGDNKCSGAQVQEVCPQSCGHSQGSNSGLRRRSGCAECSASIRSKHSLRGLRSAHRSLRCSFKQPGRRFHVDGWQEQLHI